MKGGKKTEHFVKHKRWKVISFSWAATTFARGLTISKNSKKYIKDTIF